MTRSGPSGFGLRIGALISAAAAVCTFASAQTPAPPARAPVTSGEYTGPKLIPDEIVAQHAAGFQAQATDPKWKRDATLPEDWAYSLPDGVATKQVSFYVDGGTRLQGKIFYPKGFDPKASYPGVAVAHGINALAVGIEKYAAAFAGRGMVAMAFDYQSYGYSDSGADELLLLEPDPTTDKDPVTRKKMRVRIKRTNLNNVEEVKAFRAAISYLQGEPGVDPNRIGSWASSNGGIVESALVGVDGRLKATVIQVMGQAPGPLRTFDLTGAALQDAITRVKTGQGAETEAGFSFKTNVDLWYRSRSRDIQSAAMLDRVRPTTAVLFLPAEKDELIGGNRSALAGSAFLTEHGVPSQVITYPGLMHFQAYSGTGFEVGSTLAGDWLVKFLGGKK
jgi:dienelactone hydrolase